MTVKVKYENGVLRPLEKVRLENYKIYEIEIRDEKESTIKESKKTGLLKFAGCIDSEEITLIRKAIDKECERINSNEW